MVKPKVVVFGGGTGLSVVLRGLKHFPVDITAVVTVADDGGSTGRLREEFNVPAMGDIRNVIVALSETEGTTENLLQYRFETYSDLDGHPIGNLMLTALMAISGDMIKAIKMLSEVLKIRGTVLPATGGNDTLVAHLVDGTIINGESNIKDAKVPVDFISYKEEPIIVEEVITAINDADLIVLGVGSLYTSVIPNIIPEDTRNAILNSKAEKVYVCNAMTEKGETDDYTVSKYIDALNKHMGCDFLDYVIVNDENIPEYILERYKKEDAYPVLIDEENLQKYNAKIIKSRLVLFKDDVVRHDSIKLASTIFSLLLD